MNLGDVCRQLRRKGINPTTLIDVGVAWGTDDLYRAFPDSQLLLVEPNPQWRTACEKILRQCGGQAVFVAAGSVSGSVDFHVWKGAEGSSSIVPDAVPNDERVETIHVPMERLDAICQSKGCQPRYVIKIDVQGAESQVISGMSGILDQTDAVIVECSMITNEGGDFSSIIEQMKQYRFLPYDLCGFNYRSRDGALAQIDVVFVPDHGKARDGLGWV